MFHSKEVPTGVINGGNRVFNSTQPILQLDDIFIDGEIYLGAVTLNETQILLGDAPLYTIYVDYWDRGALGSVIQVQDIKDEFERVKRDIDDVDDPLFCSWVRFTTWFIYDYLKGVDASRFVQSQTYTITLPPETEVLPIDFQDLNQTVCGFYKCSTGTTTPTTYKLGMTSFGSDDEGYYLEGNNVIFTGAEDSTSKSYVMKYMPLPPTINQLTDYITLDGTATGQALLQERHMKYMVDAIDVLYEQWDDDAGKESVADFRFVRALGGLLTNYNRAPQVSTMTNPSNFA